MTDWRKYPFNGLDEVEDTGHGDYRVSFYANEGDTGLSSRAALIIYVEGDRAAVGQSRTLPTRNWVEIAEVYKRAAEFMRWTGLKDA